MRGRTQRTYNNKLNKLQSRYNRLSKGEKFKVKYPTFDSFLKVSKLKEISHSPERKSKITTSSDYIGYKGWGR